MKKTVFVRLNSFEETVYKTILAMTEAEFSDKVAISDNQTHHDLIVMVRKFKILQLPLPDYLDNLKQEEYPAADASKKLMKQRKIPTGIDELSDVNFRKLSLIIFRSMVQYL